MPENESTIGGCSACEADGVRVTEVEVTGRDEPAFLCHLCRVTYTGNLVKYPDVSHGSGPDILKNQVRLSRIILRRLRKIEGTLGSRAAGGANAELRQRIAELEAGVTERQRHVDDYDAAATRARNALADAGVPELEGDAPGRALDLEARIKLLAGWRKVVEDCVRIFECPDELTTPLACNVPNLIRDLKSGIVHSPTCECDEPGDGPCPVHFRENDLQEVVIAAKESVDAVIRELRQGTTDATIRDALVIMEELQGVLEAGPRPRISSSEPRDAIQWRGSVGLHAGTAAVILAGPSIRKAFLTTHDADPPDAELWAPIEMAIRNHLGNAMRGEEVHGFDVKVNAETNPPSLLEAGRVAAHVFVSMNPGPTAFASRFEFWVDDGRLVVRSSSLAGGEYISEAPE